MVKLNDYDTEKVEDAGIFTPIPTNDYVVVVESSELKDNNQGTGQYLKMVYSVVEEGEFQGRKIFENLNTSFNDTDTDPKHATAQRIGQGKLKKLCYAVGIRGKLDDTDEMNQIPFIAKVSIKKSTNPDYPDPQNIIKDYLEYVGPGETSPAKQPAAAAAVEKPKIQPAAKQQGAGQPWKKGK